MRCGCANHVLQVEQTIAVAGALREQDLPADARDVLFEAFRDWKHGRETAPGPV